MQLRDYYNTSRLTAKQVGQCNSWEFPAITKKLKSQESQEKAATILQNKEELEQQIATAKKLGYDEGFAQGKLAGQQAGMADLANQAKAFAEMLQQISANMQAVEEIIPTELVKLATIIAKAVIRQELTMNSQQIVALVKEVLNYLPKNVAEITLHLHPEDIKVLQDNLELELVPSFKHINFIADQTLTRGGFHLATSESYLDATLETRIQQIMADLNSVTHDTTDN